MHVCLCTAYLPSDHRGQKKGSYTLELELQMIVDHHEGYGNQILVICNSSHDLNHRASLQSPDMFFLWTV